MIKAATIREGWRRAALDLATVKTEPQFLVVEIEDATPPSDAELKSWDDQARERGYERPCTVAQVLMPQQVVASTGTVDEAFAEGWHLFGRARRRGLRFSGWRETYFERLTGTVIPADQTPRKLHANRLKQIIDKLNSWTKNVSAALYAHTAHERDAPRPRGAPCLQYVQFEPTSNGRLNLIALYRAHDYGNKAPGNFVGLARLLAFVAKRTNRNIGGLTVFSVHPTRGGSKKALAEYANAV